MESCGARDFPLMVQIRQSPMSGSHSLCSRARDFTCPWVFSDSGENCTTFFKNETTPPAEAIRFQSMSGSDMFTVPSSLVAQLTQDPMDIF